MVLAPGFPAVNTASYWGLHCRERRSPDDVTRPKKPFEMTLRAPMEKPRDQKWDANWFEG